MPDFLISDIRETAHRGTDDLLSAGLGLDGLRAKPPVFADAAAPTPAELRRRAIHTNWNGIADLGPLGGYGTLYGGVPNVPGREYQAFATIPGAQSPHRVLTQVPDHFDTRAPCLLVAPSSGSRGIYAAIALAGAWGLPRGCAVVYTDKGTGTGYFDAISDTGVQLDGTRGRRGDAVLEFEPAGNRAEYGVAVKHAHSGDHPEADWGRHVLQAAAFGLAMLDRAHPQQAPFTPANTQIIAVGLSNGGAAVLQAAGIDTAHQLAGVVALEPNVHVEGYGRALYDYATEAALYLPCALADARFSAIPFARVHGELAPAWRARCARLREAGLIGGADIAARARSALDHLRASGWDERTLETAASTTAFDLWRTLAATYASAYLRAPAGAMPCGFHFGALAANEVSSTPDVAARAAWWADANGMPPGAGIVLLGASDASSDPTAAGIDGLRALWSGDGADAVALRASVAETAVRIPRAQLPIIVAQGEVDGLLPIAFSSAPYVAALEAAGCSPVYWRVPHAQHFDAFLALPAFGDRHVPLMPYGYAALDALWSHLTQDTPLPPSRRFATTPRGATVLNGASLDLQDARAQSPPADRSVR
ncbi:MAG: 3-hydroxybutyrate oligomer hydrolase family protein [Dokdonella sp.]